MAAPGGSFDCSPVILWTLLESDAPKTSSCQLKSSTRILKTQRRNVVILLRITASLYKVIVIVKVLEILERWAEAANALTFRFCHLFWSLFPVCLRVGKVAIGRSDQCTKTPERAEQKSSWDIGVKVERLRLRCSNRMKASVAQNPFRVQEKEKLFLVFFWPWSVTHNRTRKAEVTCPRVWLAVLALLFSHVFIKHR